MQAEPYLRGGSLSDGTAAGTSQVIDLIPGAGSGIGYVIDR